MIPLIGLLLCVYLAFKGVEIFQLSYVNKDARPASLVLGIIMMIGGFLIAAIFGLMFLTSGSSARLPTLP